MKARDLMTKDVKTCSPTDTLTHAARIMWDHDCGCVPVVGADATVAGMITDRDVCMATYTQGRAPADIRVETAMSHEIYGCAPDDSIEVIEATMQRHQVRRLPVLNRDKRLVGVIALADLGCSDDEAAQGALKDISQPSAKERR